MENPGDLSQIATSTMKYTRPEVIAQGRAGAAIHGQKKLGPYHELGTSAYLLTQTAYEGDE